MKPRFITGIALGIILCIIVTGIVSADLPVNATPETQGLKSTTSMNVQESITASTALSWQQSNNGGLNDPPLENGGWPTNYIVGDEVISGYTVDPFIIDIMGPPPGGEVQYTAGYSELTDGRGGTTDYSKTISADNSRYYTSKEYHEPKEHHLCTNVYQMGLDRSH